MFCDKLLMRMFSTVSFGSHDIVTVDLPFLDLNINHYINLPSNSWVPGGRMWHGCCLLCKCFRNCLGNRNVIWY